MIPDNDSSPVETPGGEPLTDPDFLEDAIPIPVNGVLDLHAFLPREIASTVEAYIDACLEKEIYDLRLIHGKGIGVQRAHIRKILSRHPAVVSFSDAPPEAGGWGATLVRLATPTRGNPQPA